MGEHILNDWFYIWHGNDSENGLPVVVLACQYPWGVLSWGYSLDEWIEILNKELKISNESRGKIPYSIRHAFGET